MELALLVLFVVFACSTLLVSAALLGKDNMVSQEAQLRQKLKVDQLAESILTGDTPDAAAFADYAAFLWNGSVWYPVVNGDDIDRSGFAEVAGDLLITDGAGVPLLTVELEAGTIIRWDRHGR